MDKKFKALIISFVLAIMLLPLISCSQNKTPPEPITIRLAAPQSPYIQDFDTNMYKLWLEEQTGLNIEITWLPLKDAEAIARQQLEDGVDLPDAYIGFSNYELFSYSNIQALGERGVIIPLNDLIEKYGTHTKELWRELDEFGIERYMKSADGNFYFMPGFSSSTITRFRQIMWLNTGWLTDLKLKIPTTTDEFRNMLLTFKEKYPGCIPMAGTEDHNSKQPYDFLFNAFIYNDIRNSRMLLTNGVVGFAPIRDEWRDALIYMRGLYDDGLYSPLSFVQDNQQMMQMANDPDDVLGAFVSPGITLTVYQNSPEIMERYIGIGPLKGPDGVQYTTVFSPLVRAAGVITKACQHPEEVFKLFDLMLSEEASLMGRYGEYGVDWEFAGEGEISIYGTPATIRIIEQIWNTPQNKHISQIGPYVSRPKFSGGVTWDGNTTDGEYMNAQASLLHRDFEPEEYLVTLIFYPEEEMRIKQIRSDISAYVTETIIEFISGVRDIHDDNEWARYLRGFKELGLEEMLEMAQTAVDRQGS